MTLHGAWDWLSSFTNLEKNLSAVKRTWRLDRMHALLADRRHPETCEFSFHLAGSKGKGSTAAFLSSILTATGRTVGLYTSPHVTDWRERITRNGQMFDETTYLRAVGVLKNYWEGMESEHRAQWIEDWGGAPTTFEWLTLAAFEIFRAEELDARVLECGLGGRLDATNAQTPSAAILTLIELEHTEILGDTHEQIAREKAGILKPQVPAWCAPQKLESLNVFRQTASQVGAPFHSFDEEIEEFETELSRDGTDLRLSLSDGTRIEATLPLLGLAQGLNAAVAAWTVHGMVREGRLELSSGDDLVSVVRAGLESTNLPGRMQIVSRSPWIVLDGAHTAESVKLLARSWDRLFGEGGTLIFGAFEGKAIESMAQALAPLFGRVVVTSPGDFRPSNPEALRQAFLQAGAPRVDVAPQPKTALDWARNEGQPTLVCGSFYLVGEVLAALG
jgi:dihydrofolate synthase/folylpolyglutamate synthase